MKRVIVRNLQGEETHGALIESPTEWIASCVASNAWGLPERWVLHKDEPHAQQYDEADVIAEEVREIETGQTAKFVKLKATYTVEVEDVSSSWMLGIALEKRRKEYPTPEEFMNAFFDGGQQALDALQARRLATKAKYPKG